MVGTKTGRFKASELNLSRPLRTIAEEDKISEWAEDTIDFFYKRIANWDTLTSSEKNKISEIIEILVGSGSVKETFQLLNKMNWNPTQVDPYIPQNLGEDVARVNQELRDNINKWRTKQIAEEQQRNKYRLGILLMGQLAPETDNADRNRE